jgi:hypothetical protein
MKLGRFAPLAAAAAVVSVATLVQAAVTFDPPTGTGFVGKGDVQEFYTWTNRELQQSAENIKFRGVSQVKKEYEWECSGGQRERSTFTQTNTNGVLSTVTRDNKQVSGFLLKGYDGLPTTNSTPLTTALNNCTTPPGATVVPGTEASLENPDSVTISYTLQISSNEGPFVDFYRYSE